MTKNEKLIDAVRYRRSVRKYDPDKEIDTSIVKKCIALSTLAPNSSNMQLWEFHHVISPSVLEQFIPLCLNQNTVKSAKQLVVVVTRKDLWKKRTNAHIKQLDSLMNGKPESDYSKREKFAFSYYRKIIPFVYGEFLGIYGMLKYFIAYCIGLFKPVYRQVRKADIRIVAHKSAALAAQTFMLSMAAEGYDTCPMEGIDSKRVKKLLKLPYNAEINMVISCGIRMPEGIYGAQFRIPFENVYKTW